MPLSALQLLVDEESGRGKPEGLQDYVVGALTKAILGGQLQSGQRLSPAKLAEELGVSHIPVREALAALEAMGHVEHTPHVGFFVAELSLSDLEDIYRLRALLEDEAHRLGVPKLDVTDLERMAELNEEMASRVKRGDEAAFVHLNREFHFIPFRKAGNERLLRFLTHLWDGAARFHASMVHARVPPDMLQRHHHGLMEAFEDKDVERVNAIMNEHRRLTLEVMRDALASEDPEDEDTGDVVDAVG